MREFWASVLFVIFLDRLTKNLIYKNLKLYQKIKILPFLNLTKVWNPGVVFGSFSSFNGIDKFLPLILVIFLVGLFLYSYFFVKERLKLICLGLIFGGGTSNLIDRLVWGKVLDFVDLHFKGYHWYTFNIADLAITLGVIGFLFLGIKNQKVEGKANVS